MFEELRERAFRANMELWKRGVVIYTWGNVSGIDRERGLVVIKPSGVSYDELTPDDLVVLDLDGKVVDGEAAERTGHRAVGSKGELAVRDREAVDDRVHT